MAAPGRTNSHLFFDETDEHAGCKRARPRDNKTKVPDCRMQSDASSPPSTAEAVPPCLASSPGSAPPSPLGSIPGPMDIRWPATLPVPTDAQERQALQSLLPGPRWKWKLDSFEPIRYVDLPRGRQVEIARTAARCGLQLEQACSLRRQVLGSVAPWKLQGSEAVELELATALEEAVGRFLLAHSVVFLTQEGIKAEAIARGESTHGLATPDFLLRSELLVNGRPVRWIEVKRWYGAGVWDQLRPWQPTVKAPLQFERYRALHGPGAVVLLQGHARGFRARVHPDVQLLDAELFRADVGAAGHDEVAAGPPDGGRQSSGRRSVGAGPPLGAT